jgi:hypothetical protein
MTTRIKKRDVSEKQTYAILLHFSSFFLPVIMTTRIKKETAQKNKHTMFARALRR